MENYKRWEYRRWKRRHWSHYHWRRFDFIPSVYESRPSDDGRGWTVRGDGNRMTAYARCCKTRIAQCRDSFSKPGNQVWSFCPKGYKYTAGGFKIIYPHHNHLQMIEDVRFANKGGRVGMMMDSGYGAGQGQSISRCCKFKTDENLCKTNNGGCDTKTKCDYKVGSYGDLECGKCPKGWLGDGKTGCKDDNECSRNNGGCDKLSKCKNTEGSFECGPCPKGYTGTGKKRVS